MHLPGLQSPHIGKVDGRGAHATRPDEDWKVRQQSRHSGSIPALTSTSSAPCLPAGITEPIGAQERAQPSQAASQPALDPQSADSYLLQEAQLGMDTLNF